MLYLEWAGTYGAEPPLHSSIDKNLEGVFFCFFLFFLPIQFLGLEIG